MPRRACPRHGQEHPCTCAMGNLYRFVEPVLLFLLRKKGQSYGYELAKDLREYALTDAEVEVAALYRTLRTRPTGMWKELARPGAFTGLQPAGKSILVSGSLSSTI